MPMESAVPNKGVSVTATSPIPYFLCEESGELSPPFPLFASSCGATYIMPPPCRTRRETRAGNPWEFCSRHERPLSGRRAAPRRSMQPELRSAQRIMLHARQSASSAEPTSRGLDCCAAHERQIRGTAAQHRDAPRRAGPGRFRRRQEGRLPEIRRGCELLGKQTFSRRRNRTSVRQRVSPLRAYSIEKLGGWSKEAISAEHFSADVPFLKRGLRESLS